jgi:hypothetical protein
LCIDELSNILFEDTSKKSMHFNNQSFVGNMEVLREYYGNEYSHLNKKDLEELLETISLVATAP